MMKTLLFFSLLLFFLNDMNADQGDTIKAKIAILHKAGDDYTSLKTKDRIKADEMMRIFILPLNNSNVYVVHTDLKESILLYDGKMKKGEDTLILPSPTEYYIFDDESPSAKVTIFCSLYKIPEIDNLFKRGETVSPGSWNSVESKLIKENKKDLDERSDKPFPLAGNVSAVNEDFLEQVLTFVGKKMLIRKYELEIKK